MALWVMCRGISWADSTVSVNLTQQAVKDAPLYNPAAPLSRDQEMGLHQHHGRAGYWAEEVKFENPQYRIPETQQSP